MFYIIKFILGMDILYTLMDMGDNLGLSSSLFQDRYLPFSPLYLIFSPSSRLHIT